MLDKYFIGSLLDLCLCGEVCIWESWERGLKALLRDHFDGKSFFFSFCNFNLHFLVLQYKFSLSSFISYSFAYY